MWYQKANAKIVSKYKWRNFKHLSTQSFFHRSFPNIVSQLAVWPEKNRQMSIKHAQKWFYEKMIDFDTFTKIP